MDVLSTIMQGESIFYPNDEDIDKKCYELNNINDWAELFYGPRKGVLLEKYCKLVSKTDYRNFFEGLNYEYGLNNYPIDLNKAFKIYKNSADNNAIDCLSSFRLYRIYKNEFNKFNMNKRNFVLEKYYILKSVSYLLEDDFVINKIDIQGELDLQLKDKSGNICSWYKKLMKLLKQNYSMYHIDRLEFDYVENKINYLYHMKSEDEFRTELSRLGRKGNLEAFSESSTLFLGNDEKFKELYYKNYFRSFLRYAKYLGIKKEIFPILKNSINNGYYHHINYYIYVFLYHQNSNQN